MGPLIPDPSGEKGGGNGMGPMKPDPSGDGREFWDDICYSAGL